MISILANIARKVDRLEYGLDGAPATAGESWLDSTADLLVYCLKYQAYLGDLDQGTASRLFGDSGIRPPYSDGPAGFEALLSRTDLGPVAVAGQPAAEAARCVVSRFGELEACCRDVSSTQPVLVRLARVQALNRRRCRAGRHAEVRAWLLAALAACGLASAVEAVYTPAADDPRLSLTVPVRSFEALRETTFRVLVVAADAEKEDLLCGPARPVRCGG